MDELIKVFDLWEQNWNNANNFFKCEGNIKTKAKLKKKWYEDFEKMFKDIDKEVNKRFG